MKKPAAILVALSLALGLSSCGQSNTGGGGLENAQSEQSDGNYPSEPVDFIVPFAPGGGADFTGRTLSRYIGAELNDNPLTVINQPGGGGRIGATNLLQAEPDGYTLGLISATVLTAYPQTGDTAYESDSFVPIARVAVTRQILQVNEDAPWQTYEDFMSYVKENPGEFTYGTGGVGTTAHLVMEMLQQETGIEVKHVPFDGLGPAKVALQGGNIDAVIGPVTGADEGVIRSLFSFSGEQGRTPEDVPLVKDKGVDVELDVVHYAMAPPGLSKEKQEVLVDAFEATIKDPEFIEAFQESNLELSYADPETVKEQIQSYSENMEKVLQNVDLDG